MFAGQHIKLWLFQLVIHRRLNFFTNLSIWRYDQWRKANKEFRIDGLFVEDYLHLSYACNWLSVGIALMFFLNICFLVPVTVVGYFDLSVIDRLVSVMDRSLDRTSFVCWFCASAIGAHAGTVNLSFMFTEVACILMILPTGWFASHNLELQFFWLILACGFAFVKWLYEYGTIFWSFVEALYDRKGLVDMTVKLPKRLCILDQGMIGAINGYHVKPGDYVCSIAGCTSFIVLSRYDVDGEERYRVVGRACVELNEEDTERIVEFPIQAQGNLYIESQIVWTRWGPRYWYTPTKTDKELLEACQKQDWWRSFVLF